MNIWQPTRSLYKAFLAIIFVSAVPVQSKVLIWDLGDTLFTTSYFTVARSIGLWRFALYAALDLKNPNIKPMVFDILDKINPSHENPQEIATDNEGNPLPAIMERWLAGTISGKEVFKSVSDYVGQLELQHYFVSSRQKDLVLKTIEKMFDPEALVDATYPIAGGITLLHDCYHAAAPDGSRKNTLFVLSNWDDVSYELLRKKYADIFETYFDNHHIIISGAIGLIKPKKAAFAYVVDTYHLDPKECIFIDDSYDNVLAAQSVGMTGLLMCKGNYATLRKILLKLGVL